MKAILVIAAATAVVLAVSKCNDKHICISVKSSGLHVETVTASTTEAFRGHFHVSGGGLNSNSAVQDWRSGKKFIVPVDKDVPNHAVICAEGWEHVSDGNELRGKVCVKVNN
ncbi:hypothetical protein GQ42DRAFT_156402 [Ramicandelaber brevisporus]|nr:hypothetical protein GQ42DRAFT_156402 [Ramicandelaber brevisporus]